MADLAFRYLHFIGNIFWLGGVVTVAVVAALLAGQAEREHAVAARGAALRIATPGLVLSWIGGLGMLLPHWSTLYARAGWMHGKITLALVAAALTGMVTGRLRRAASGEGELHAGRLRLLATVLLVIAFTVAGLGVFRPGG
jgi:protoporphyrinogen IX oxidase